MFTTGARGNSKIGYALLPLSNKGILRYFEWPVIRTWTVLDIQARATYVFMEHLYRTFSLISISNEIGSTNLVNLTLQLPDWNWYLNPIPSVPVHLWTDRSGL